MKNNLLKIEEYRNNPEFYFSNGMRHANRKNLDEAYKNMSKALELEPDNCEYKFNMACFLSEMQCPKEANRIFNDILINFEPTMYDCFFGLGCNCFEMGDYNKAAEYFDKYLYFDGEGAFSEEVSEMAFYLKLYNEIPANSDFVKTSISSLKRAQKSLRENNSENAIKQLYKSINANPLNIEARNLLTLAFMERQQYIRALYINSTVEIIDIEDIWSECLSIFIISNAKRHAKVKKSLDVLPFRTIKSREDLLCVAVTLMTFDRLDELVKLMEMYIVEYNDVFIYCILLLGYLLCRKTGNAEKMTDIIESLTGENESLRRWLELTKDYISANEINFSIREEYEKLFFASNEPFNYKYHPNKYFDLIRTNHAANAKPGKKHLAIIEGTLQHREIMYSQHYRREILELLTSLKLDAGEPDEAVNDSMDTYSAVLEYIYCSKYNIEMEKKDLIQKYNINSGSFEHIFKKIKRKNNFV